MSFESINRKVFLGVLQIPVGQAMGDGRSVCLRGERWPVKKPLLAKRRRLSKKLKENATALRFDVKMNWLLMLRSQVQVYDSLFSRQHTVINRHKTHTLSSFRFHFLTKHYVDV